MSALAATLATVAAKLNLPANWTGRLSFNVYRGQVTREGHEVTESRTVCPRCGEVPEVTLHDRGERFSSRP